jgi:hypothetical protein
MTATRTFLSFSDMIFSTAQDFCDAYRFSIVVHSNFSLMERDVCLFFQSRICPNARREQMGDYQYGRMDYLYRKEPHPKSMALFSILISLTRTELHKGEPAAAVDSL